MVKILGQKIKLLDYHKLEASNDFLPRRAKLSSVGWDGIHLELHQQPKFEIEEHQHNMHVIALGSSTLGFSNSSGERWLDGKIQQEIVIATPDGEMPAFLCVPIENRFQPAVLVLMEAFGLTPHIKDVTSRIAQEGYLAIAPDLYYRELPDNKFGYDEAESARSMMYSLDFNKIVEEDVKATLDYLKSRADVNSQRIGVTGFCFGGSMTFCTATKFSSQIAVAAPFYSVVLDEWLEAVKDITVPIYLFFGGADSFIPVRRIQEIDSRFKELDKNYKLKVYNDAEHGFFCHERFSYNRLAAEDSWHELTKFLTKYLSE